MCSYEGPTLQVNSWRGGSGATLLKLSVLKEHFLPPPISEASVPLTVKVLAAQSCLTLRTPWAVAARLLCLWASPGKSTEAGSHSLLQGIFLTQGWNPVSLLSLQADPLPSEPPGDIPIFFYDVIKMHSWKNIPLLGCHRNIKLL